MHTVYDVSDRRFVCAIFLASADMTSFKCSGCIITDDFDSVCYSGVDLDLIARSRGANCISTWQRARCLTEDNMVDIVRDNIQHS